MKTVLKPAVAISLVLAACLMSTQAFADKRHHGKHHGWDGPRYAGYSSCKPHPVFGVNPGHHRHEDYRRTGWRDDRYYYGRRDPLVTSTLAGAAIGASTGAVMGKPVLRSALIGTGFGAGLGLLRESGY